MSVRGFTLLEVLVALAILSIGLAAATRAIAWSTDSTDALRTRQMADWVAQNQLAMLRASHKPPPSDVQTGETVQGGQTYLWQQESSSLGQMPFHQVTIRVSKTGAQAPLSRLTAYLPVMP